MKTIRLIILIAFMVFGRSSQAQNESSVSDGWQSVYVQWNPINIENGSKSGDDQAMTGFSAGYNKAFNILKDMPLFVEAGVGVQYSYYHVDGKEFNEDDDDTAKYKTFMGIFSAKVPVNLTYKWKVSPSVNLLPHIGLTARYNITGSTYNDDIDESLPKSDIKKMEKSKDPFDKNDMGSKDNTLEHFQLGWQLGINAQFNKSLLLGISYGSDFSDIAKKKTIHTTSVTIGYFF